MHVQKISILSPQKGLEFPGGGGLCKAKKFKECMKLNWNFSFCGGGMDILWNYTMYFKSVKRQIS